MDSGGLIYGRCLLNFHVKLPFCDIGDTLLLFPMDWWLPGASLLLSFLCVATSGVIHYLPKRPFSLMNNTSPSHPETMKQTDCSSRGIPPPPSTADHDSCVPLPARLAPGTSPLPLSLLMDSFPLSHCLAVPIVWACCLVHGAAFLNSTLDGGVFFFV